MPTINSSITPSIVVVSALLLLLSSTSVVADALDGCGSVLLAVGSYNDISWIQPPVSGEGVSIMSLTLCGAPDAPNATLTTELLMGVNDTGSNPGYCDQLSSTTIMCANEIPDGSVAMLDLTSTTPPQLFPLNVTNPVYVELLSSGLVATANYGGSSFTTFDAMKDPSMAVIDTVEIPLENATMSLGNPDRQEAPHPHMATEVVDGELLVADLGSDAVYQYSVSPDGMLTWQGTTVTAPGAGPRHAAVGKMGKVYVLNELLHEILELDSSCVEGVNGTARGICATTQIPEPDDGTVYLSAAAIRVSEDQEYVYASMRRDESINALGALVGYKVEANGSLGELVGVWESGGTQPRDFDIVNVPGFKEVFVVANRKSNSVDVIDRNATTGEAGELLVTTGVNSPTSVLPLENITSAELNGSAFEPVNSTVPAVDAGAPLVAPPGAPTGPSDDGANSTDVGTRGGVDVLDDQTTSAPGADVQTGNAAVGASSAVLFAVAAALLESM